jgi:hypothetical protein
METPPQMTDFESWQQILDILEQGGMTDYDKYPEVYVAWKVAKDTDDLSLLHESLTQNPWLLTEAIKSIRECPFLPYPSGLELENIQGEYVLGYVNGDFGVTGLDALDFTRGLFICGETGSGKSYPILRLCAQILSIPRKEHEN